MQAILLISTHSINITNSFTMPSIRCIIIKILVWIFICDIVDQTTASPINKSKNGDSKLIVISLDGLMFNQIQPDSMPFILNLSRNGVLCSQMQPVFPTKTLVNHFSIATGLHTNFDFLLFFSKNQQKISGTTLFYCD